MNNKRTLLLGITLLALCLSLNGATTNTTTITIVYPASGDAQSITPLNANFANIVTWATAQTNTTASLQSQVTANTSTGSTHTAEIGTLFTTQAVNTASIASGAASISGLLTTQAVHTSEISLSFTTQAVHTADISYLFTTQATHTAEIALLEPAMIVDILTTQAVHTAQIDNAVSTNATQTADIANLMITNNSNTIKVDAAIVTNGTQQVQIDNAVSTNANQTTQIDNLTITNAANTTSISVLSTNAITKSGGGVIANDLTVTGATYVETPTESTEAATKGYVDQQALAGDIWYLTSVVTNETWFKTTNFVNLSKILPASFTNTTPTVTSDTYLAGGQTTNLLGVLRSPAAFKVKWARVGGNSASRMPCKMEYYYVINGTTNLLGDWSSGYKTPTSTTPQDETFSVEFNEVSIPAGATVHAYLKSGTVSGSAARIAIYGGTDHGSHMNLRGIAQGETFGDALHINGDNAMTGNLNGGGQNATNFVDIDITGSYKTNGVALVLGGGTGSQTPWTATVNADTYGLTNVSSVVGTNGVNQMSVPMFFATISAGQVFTNSVITRMMFDQTAYNVGSGFNTSTYIFTPPVSGKYKFSVANVLGNVGATIGCVLRIRKDEANAMYWGNYSSAAVAALYVRGEYCYDLVTTNKIDVTFVHYDSAAKTNIVAPVYFSGQYLGE